MKRLLLVLLLVACKKTDDQPRPSPSPSPSPSPTAPAAIDAASVATTATDAPVVVDAASAALVPDAPAGALDARADGVGPITEKTKVDIKALKAAFPGYEIKKVSKKMGDGDLREVYVGVSKGGTLILKLVGDEFLTSVDIMSNDVWNPWGLTIGMTGAELEKRVGKLDCSDAGEATDWRANLAECDGEKVDHYQFDLDGDGMGKELAKDPAKRAAAKLVAIRWVVPGNGPPGTK